LGFLLKTSCINFGQEVLVYCNKQLVSYKVTYADLELTNRYV